jgi:hypothetical protein
MLAALHQRPRGTLPPRRTSPTPSRLDTEAMLVETGLMVGGTCRIAAPSSRPNW